MESQQPVQLIGMALLRGLLDESALRQALGSERALLEALQAQGSLDANDLADLAHLLENSRDSPTGPLNEDEAAAPPSEDAVGQDPWETQSPKPTGGDGSGRQVLRVATLPVWKHYRNLRFVAEGGMGRVFKAFDPRLKRMVALKFLRGRDAELVARFRLEAQNQARVEHPNICKVFDVGEWQGQSYIAMQFIQGETLESAAIGLSLIEQVKVMEAVAEAIHAAHHQGLIHRDLKPANIMVERGERGPKPTVLDFGLAKGQEPTGLTVQGMVVGTTHYMAPEQARGDHASVGRRTDVYGLGATLHRVLTGCAPFSDSKGAEVLRRTLEEDVPSLTHLLPGLSEDLDTIVRKCLEKEPSRRYESALAVAEDLRRWREGEPILARPASLAGRLGRRVKRHRTLSLTLTASVLAVIGLLGWNARTRMIGRRQVEVAQRFGMEVKEIESLLRIERMLPVHDMRPVEGQVRARLERLRQSMAALGPSAEGPGQYAIGRGLLAMRDYPKALESLERAWEVGYRPPEVAATLAQVHLAMGEKDRSLGARNQDGPPGAQDSPEPWRFHWDKALLFFRLTEGQGVESASFAKAQVAYLEKRMAECIALSEQALQEQPWRYEALLLAGQAVVESARDGSSLGGQQLGTLRPLYRAAVTTLERAASMARSDVDVYRNLLMAIKAGSILESEGGTPSLEPLARARQLFETALKIQPDDSTMAEWQRTFAREIFLRLAAGEDTRDICRDIIEHGKEVTLAAPKGLGALREIDNIGYWLLGESQWRRGEDPRAALEAALSAYSQANYNQAEVLNVLARYEGQHGRDIRGRVKRAEQILLGEIRKEPKYAYMYILWGECLTIESQWEFWTNRNPWDAIRRGKAHLDDGIHRQPGSVYSYFHLPLLHAMEARLALAQGQNPAPSVAAALRTARAGAAIRANHFRTQLALAEAHHVAALADIQAHRDPSAHLTQARKAVRDAWALNGTDWRIALAESRLALTEAELDQAVGKAPGTNLLRADRAAEKGLRVKADAPELLLCRAESARLNARWTGSPEARAKAEAFTRQAHAFNPEMNFPQGQ